MYRVNELFLSLQGEGARAGSLNVFVRLSHCNLRCNKEKDGFDCDTDFEGGFELTAAELFERIKTLGGKCKNVIFTGGEPTLQLNNDPEILSLLKQEDYYLALETNGTVACTYGVGDWKKVFDWISCSPKTAEHTIRVSEFCINELRYVRAVNQALPAPKLNAAHYYLSPVFRPDGSMDRDAYDWCVSLIRENPDWSLSVQQHKLWRVR